MSVAVAVLLAAVAAVPPSVDAVTPSPLAVGSQAEIDGGGFVEGATTVTISGSVQKVVMVQEAKVRFVVASDTPLGAGTLVVTTPAGQGSHPVEVAPAPPRILSVSPDPVVLGAPVTVEGTDLGSVDTVTLGGLACEVTSQTAALLVCVPPLEPDLVGGSDLVVGSPYGFDVATVEAAPPVPVVDKLSPNPVTPGDLLEVAGVFVPWSVGVTVGGQPARVVGVSASTVVVEVPPSLSPGAVEVVLRTGDVASEPQGPLLVEAPDPQRPVVERVVPGIVAQGGTAWVVGQHLDRVTWSTPDVTVADCGPRACRVLPDVDEPGPFVGALGGAEGAAVFELQVVEGPPVEPVLVGVEPDPVFVGDLLTLHGEGLHQVTWAVVGGVVQEVESVDVDRVEVRVVEGTPLGAERLFVAGRSASEAWTVTILEPFPEPQPEPGPEPAPDAPPESEGEPDAGGDAGPSEDAVEEPGEDGGSGGGCAGGPAGPLSWLAALLVLAARRRRA